VVTDRPIIFSAPMVRALLDGKKTQTRRVLKPQFPDWVSEAGFTCFTPKGHASGRGIYVDDQGLDHGPAEKFIKLPYAVGDRLWVREAWACINDNQWRPEDVIFRADGNEGWRHGWRPSIHMPRWASRLTLTVTDGRVQRLQEISEADAVAEGVRRIGADYIAAGSTAFNDGPNFYTVEIDAEGWSFNQPTAQECFAGLWRHIHGDGAWDANPWVTAVTFTVERRNIDAKES